MNYLKIYDCDLANGPGFRISLFVSGCSLHCKGCFNPETWDFKCGKRFTKKTEDKIIQLLNRPYIRGLSILGGNPTEPKNEPALIKLCKRVRKELPDKDIWLWTGHEFEDLVHVVIKDEAGNVVVDNKKKDDELIQLCDVVVDGPFVEEMKDPALKFRGSSNQRVIDVKRYTNMLKTNYAGVTWKEANEAVSVCG